MAGKDNHRAPQQDTNNTDQGSGKVANDHNSAGNQEPTQLHQERRTPESRHDRESHIGSSNQVQARKAGGAGSGGRSTRGAG